MNSLIVRPMKESSIRNAVDEGRNYAWRLDAAFSSSLL